VKKNGKKEIVEQKEESSLKPYRSPDWFDRELDKEKWSLYGKELDLEEKKRLISFMELLIEIDKKTNKKRKEEQDKGTK
jgi:hypothetical protein